eukprot:scaffold145712_cov21-Tisochrysis_lutea.AAC.1
MNAQGKHSPKGCSHENMKALQALYIKGGWRGGWGSSLTESGEQQEEHALIGVYVCDWPMLPACHVC